MMPNRIKEYKLYTPEEVIQIATEKNYKDQEWMDLKCLNSFLRKKDDTKYIAQGFFFCDDTDDASYLAGAFFEHFGYVCASIPSNTDNLKTVEEMIRYNFTWQMDLFKQYDSMKNRSIILDSHLIAPTKEFPYEIYICGSDDASWTRTFATEDDVHMMLFKLWICCKDVKCGGIHHIIKENGFVFTN